MFIIQSKEKQRNSVKLLTNIKIIFWFETQNVNTPHKEFYSFIPITTNTRKDGNVKENVSCTSCGIHLLSTFETLAQKLIVQYLCSTKITLEWITPPSPPIFRSIPHYAICTSPLIFNFFQPSAIFQYFELSIAHFVTWGFKLWKCLKKYYKASNRCK